MRKLRDAIKRQSVYFATEFVIIVLGVLVALGVDEWRGEFAIERQRTHVLTSLLVDLKEDEEDYRHFVEVARDRANIAEALTAVDPPTSVPFRGSPIGAGEGMFQLGISGWLQTHRGAFQEMTATGAGISVADDALRSRILRYYALATNRARINEFIEPELHRYHAALEELGIAYTAAGAIPVDSALASQRVVAVIRNIGVTARFAVTYVEDLIQANRELIAALEEELAES